MKLPPLNSFNINWKPDVQVNWKNLINEVKELGSNAGKGDEFQKVLIQLKDMARTANFSDLVSLMQSRIAARALTQLWLEDQSVKKRLLNSKMLNSLVLMQKPRLGIIALQNLITLYFKDYDLLDLLASNEQKSLREALELLIKEQLNLRLLDVSNDQPRSLLFVLHSEATWLLSENGPINLVNLTKASNTELSESFVKYQLQGLDVGRYGDVCRAHYYLETLKSIPIGQYDDVLDELLKPTVSKAPYQNEKRIGHVAMEILIDRVNEDPSEIWQNFIIDLAGDPRIASNAPNFREWWQPLGEDRVNKVRSWLAKEDLRLFLSALDQYGKDTDNHEFQRMFPARKHFLEGLERMKLIKQTRLMLGNTAAYAVKKILGSDLKTSYIQLTGMNDKAVIYIDCGDFCLIEGSHSFKLWVYLAPPNKLISSYDTRSLSLQALTTKTSNAYKQTYGDDAPYVGITHSPNIWQNKVIAFLASHGIRLNIEALLSPVDYKRYLSRFGVPFVKSPKTVLTALNQDKTEAVGKNTINPNSASKYNRAEKHLFDEKINNDLSKAAIDVLYYMYLNPRANIKFIAYFLQSTDKKISNVINNELQSLCIQSRNGGWKILPAGVEKLTLLGVIK